MSEKSLQELLAGAANPVEALRTIPHRPLHFVPGLTQEHTNWRSEQLAWHQTAALTDQSHHSMTLFVKGPDALRVFNELGVNSFKTFAVNQAKQFVAVNEEGYLIGDAVLVYLDDDSFALIGEWIILYWVQFHIEKGDYNVTFEEAATSVTRQGAPKEYRYEIQGPTAAKIIEKIIGHAVPETKFFHLTEFTIAGKRVRAIRHNMAGQPGYELFGPWEDGEAVRNALLEAGEEYGLKPAGSIAYFTSGVESGWIGHPLPAIFSSESTRAFRQWLPAKWVLPLGGSFDSPNIEDYYVIPHDLGYGRIVSNNHDFLGRDGLTALAAKGHRTKVTFEWNADDFAALFRELADGSGEAPPQHFQLGSPRYAYYEYDAIRHEGQTVGLRTHSSYLAPYRRMLSLGYVDPEFAAPGTELELLWGDSLTMPRPEIELHRQVPIRVTVQPSPYSQFARSAYRQD